MLNEFRFSGGFGKWCEFSTQGQSAGNATHRRSRQEDQAAKEKEEMFRFIATDDTQDRDGNHEDELSNHPPSAALGKAACHNSGRESEMLMPKV